jgi:hypothetical protein
MYTAQNADFGPNGFYRRRLKYEKIREDDEHKVIMIAR